MRTESSNWIGLGSAKDNRALFQSFTRSHNCVLLLFWIVLHDAGAEVEDQEAEEAAEEDEQGAGRNLKDVHLQFWLRTLALELLLLQILK